MNRVKVLIPSALYVLTLIIVMMEAFTLGSLVASEGLGWKIMFSFFAVMLLLALCHYVYVNIIIVFRGRLWVLGRWRRPVAYRELGPLRAGLSGPGVPGKCPMVILIDDQGLEEEIVMLAFGYYWPFDRWLLPRKIKKIKAALDAFLEER